MSIIMFIVLDFAFNVSIHSLVKTFVNMTKSDDANGHRRGRFDGFCLCNLLNQLLYLQQYIGIFIHVCWLFHSV